MEILSIAATIAGFAVNDAISTAQNKAEGAPVAMAGFR
jgi:hypothetical protein